MDPWTLMTFFSSSLKDLFLLILEKGRGEGERGGGRGGVRLGVGGEREMRDKYRLVVSHTCPDQESNLEPRYAP